MNKAAGITCMVICFILAIGLMIWNADQIHKANKSKDKKIKKEPFVKKSLIISIGTALSFCGAFLAIYPAKEITPLTSELIQTLFGSLVFGYLINLILDFFLLHYYGHLEDQKLDKKIFNSLAIMLPVIFVFIFMLSNGFADYLNATEPLHNGINFKTGLTRPLTSQKPTIAWYALCILSGALYTYFYVDHKFYMEYGKHGICESTFLVAFPAGIVGARLFYVIGTWEEQFKGKPFIDIINIRSGGLTILGGAITGIVVGAIWFLTRKKQYNIWLAVDIIVPAILIGQAVGRWGNFFNVEVHGKISSIQGWEWLPKVIINNGRWSSDLPKAPDGQFYIPLFFFESLVNWLGFFVLSHLFGKKWRKYTQFGDLALGYVVWYGLTRVIFEPIRDVNYQMNTWSWIWSFVFVAVGSLGIGVNHLIRYFIDKKKGNITPDLSWYKRGVKITSVTAGVATALLTLGIILMTKNPFLDEVSLNPWSWGLISIVLGICLIFGLMCCLPKTIAGYKLVKKEKQNA